MLDPKLVIVSPFKFELSDFTLVNADKVIAFMCLIFCVFNQMQIKDWVVAFMFPFVAAFIFLFVVVFLFPFDLYRRQGARVPNLKSSIFSSKRDKSGVFMRGLHASNFLGTWELDFFLGLVLKIYLNELIAFAVYVDYHIVRHKSDKRVCRKRIT